MANNKSAVFFVMLLAFLFLLTAPLVLVFGHYSDLLQLPAFVTYHNVSIAATAGLFIILVLFIYLGAVIVALKKRRRAGISFVTVAKVAVAKKRVPVRYAWEDVFGPEKEQAAEKPRPLRPVSVRSAPANSKAIAAVVIALAVVGLIILASVTPSLSSAFGRGHNETKSANITQPAVQPAVAANNGANATRENALSRFLSAVTRVQPPPEPAKQLVKEEKQVKVSAPKNNSASSALQMKKAFAAVKGFAGKIKRSVLNSISSLKSRVSKVPNAVWQKIAIAAVVILFAGSVLYSHKTGQLGGIPEWFRGWFDWLAGVLAAARKNIWKVIGVVIAAALIGVFIAATVFRKWLSAHGINVKLPAMSGLPSSPLDALIAVRDFVSVYRLYIIIGVFAFLAIIGILFAFEKKEKK